MARKRRIGNRRHVAKVTRHNGNTDSHGNPTYEISADWTILISAWPCEMLSTGGGEVIRGRQVAAETSHVLFGEYSGGRKIDPDCRVEVFDPAAGKQVVYGVVSSYDVEGDRREMRVELRREVNQ